MLSIVSSNSAYSGIYRRSQTLPHLTINQYSYIESVYKVNKYVFAREWANDVNANWILFTGNNINGNPVETIPSNGELNFKVKKKKSNTKKGFSWPSTYQSPAFARGTNTQFTFQCVCGRGSYFLLSQKKCVKVSK